MKYTFLSLSLALGLSVSSIPFGYAKDVSVRFDLNYKTQELAPASLTVRENSALKLQEKPIPERPGYRFAGWYTDKACTREWLFGTKSSGFMQSATDSMAVTASMTLYARWVAPVHIRDARGLDRIREDLYGWYVLDSDIDLSSYPDWLPIGSYEADYEFADGEWWLQAFKGRLDGNGHSIKNLSITRLEQPKKGLFGSMANAEIHDLVLESPRIMLQGENPYVAPLVGVMKEDGGRHCIVDHVRVESAVIDLTVNNDSGAFVSATALSGGTWNGTLSNCQVSGTIRIRMADNGGGELYVGGLTGEPYCMSRDCVSDIDIEIVFDRASAQGGLNCYIGGLQAGATEVRNCESYGTIRLRGDNGKGEINVGGLIGSERYGSVVGSRSHVRIEAEGLRHLRTGGIAGEFNSQYAMIGTLSGIKETSIVDCHADGSLHTENIGNLMSGEICGSGQPEPLNAWGQTMTYRIEGCTSGTPVDSGSEEGFPAEAGELNGTWYGLQNNTLVTVVFTGDGHFSMDSESNSNMDIEGSFTQNPKNRTLDFPQTSSGMAAAGRYQSHPDGSLDLNMNFGIPGMLQRPSGLTPDPASMTSMFLHLQRDKAELDAALAYKVDIPAQSALAFERNRRLGAGINLNAVVDGNKHPGFERDAPLPDEEIASIAKVGFQSVRLDVCWAKHASFQYPYTIDPAFFDKVDHIVDECLKNGLAVSIDQHYYPYINMEQKDKNISPEDNYKRLECLWDQISRHYRDYPDDMLFFDLLNEPNLSMGADRWNELIATLIKTIRKTNPGRTLIVSTPNLGQHWTINCLELPEDEWNLIVEFHYYLPHLFTHQGMSYAMAGQIHGVDWMGTEADMAPILHDLDYCKRWSDTHGRPLNMGEYGVVNTADEASRARYIGFLLNAAKERGFSSHLWGYREPFMIRNQDSGEWIPRILDAMELTYFSRNPRSAN